MGSQKPAYVRRIANELFRFYGDQFTDSFEENKLVVQRLLGDVSKKVRNWVAAQVTQLVKRSRGEARE
ncbi:TPA: 30S ribosomal protein S17e [Candidatus Bathyarchaeota archaeon]|nr:30S ribosomal protein S17e [Candidatus Bathyarchaeota archaeon]